MINVNVLLNLFASGSAFHSHSAPVGQNGGIEEREIWAHINREGAGDEIEGGVAFRGRGEDGSRYTASDPPAELSRGEGQDCDCGIAQRRSIAEGSPGTTAKAGIYAPLIELVLNAEEPSFVSSFIRVQECFRRRH